MSSPAQVQSAYRLVQPTPEQSLASRRARTQSSSENLVTVKSKRTLLDPVKARSQRRRKCSGHPHAPSGLTFHDQIANRNLRRGSRLLFGNARICGFVGFGSESRPNVKNVRLVCDDYGRCWRTEPAYGPDYRYDPYYRYGYPPLTKWERKGSCPPGQAKKGNC